MPFRSSSPKTVENNLVRVETADTVIQACKHKVTGRLRAVASADAW